MTKPTSDKHAIPKGEAEWNLADYPGEFEVRIGMRLDVWFQPMLKRIACRVTDVELDQDGVLCVTLGSLDK